MYGILKSSFIIFFFFKGIDEIIVIRLRILEFDKISLLGNVKCCLVINVVFLN